jgi:hypothetical protein
MPDIQPIVTRMAMVTTENTGGALDITGPEGVAEFRRLDPYGVLIQFGPGVHLSVHKDLLPIVGRYFLAAAILLGVDVNDGWDKLQIGGPGGQ